MSAVGVGVGTMAPPVGASAGPRAALVRPAAALAYDWLLTAVSGWLVGGIWLDAWAHHHVSSTLETFFTPWHGVLYSGMLAVAVALGATAARNVAGGCSLQRALPAGYGWSAIGVLLFAVGGAADGVWHTLFGIEVNLEALLSPSHLLLGLGGFLIATGPLRAGWRRGDAAAAPWSEVVPWRQLLPALLALGFTLSLLVFFTSYANPFGEPWPSGTIAELPTLVPLTPADVQSPVAQMLGQTLGVVAILLHTGILMGAVFLALRRWALPFGALSVLFVLVVGLSVTAHDEYRFIPSALLAGLLADLLAARLRPGRGAGGSVAWTRLFGFAVPVALFGLYFATFALAGDLAWSVHLWSGSIALAGAVGLLLSYLLVPPRLDPTPGMDPVPEMEAVD